MKYSVIIPLYNKAPYARKALESVAAQTFRDFELIIVDDGSTDNSATICEEFLSQFSTLDSQLIRQANSGVAAARNRGVDESHGEYVCFLDADDWWESTFLEEMDRLIAEYPNAGLYATNYIYYKPGKTHVALKLSRGYMNYPEAYLKSGAMPVTSITTCMSRKVFDEMGGFPVGVKLGEDFLLWARTAIKYPVVFCEKPLAYYNNDVLPSLRATRNIYAPENHMLFHLNPLLGDINRLQSTSNRLAWVQLVDKLRVNGLLDYWLNERYHDTAAAELAKVDWTKQMQSAKAQYEKPIWLFKIKRRIMKIGSYCKQKLIRMMTK